MTTENVYVYSGLQKVVAYELNGKGRPKGTGTTAYTGIEVYAANGWNPTIPDPRTVPHVGNDRLLKTQIFPGQEPAIGELAVGAEDLDLIALITGATIKTISGAVMLPHLSDLQGKEKTIGLMLAQEAVSKRHSYPGYRFHMLSSVKMSVKIPGGSNEAQNTVYRMAINPSEYYLFGSPLAPLADIYDEDSGVPETGAREAGLWSGFSRYRLRIAAFVSGAATTEFLLPEHLQAANVTDFTVLTATSTDDYASVVDPADYTPAVGKITFDATPGNGTEVLVLFPEAE